MGKTMDKAMGKVMRGTIRPTVEPEIELISACRLTVDAAVQRSLDQARVNRIIAGYNPDALGVIIVSDRGDGTLHVIDGQHRIAATIGVGHGTWPLKCLVYKGLTRADEGELFAVLNTTRAVQSLDKFRVRVVAGDPGAVLLNSVIERHGWTVRQSKAAGSFAAVTALEAVYRAGRERDEDNVVVCNRLLSLITLAWGHNPDGVRGELVSGIGAVLLRYGDSVDRIKLVAELSAFPGGPRAVIGQAKGLRALSGGRVNDAMAEIVVNLLNKGRRKNRLPDWRDNTA